MFIVLVSSKKRLIPLFLLLMFCGLFFFKGSLLRHYYGVKPDVIFLQQNLGGETREKVREIVAARFGEWQLDPEDAQYDPLTNQIVPGLWGYAVNMPETVDKIMGAAKGEQVFPVYENIFPEITIEDYPAAIITRGNPAKKQISLMINVAWGTEYILPMLEILKAEGAYGTFFLVGRWADQNNQLMKEISAQGHLLANHGHTDSVVYTALAKEEIEQGLKVVNDQVYAVAGKKPLYFTPHKGEYNDLVLEMVSRAGMRTILWSIDTVDWSTPGVEKMKAKILDNLHEGAVILMHPTADTVILLKEVVPLIKSKGYSIVTLDELLDPCYPPDKRE